jgi:fibronectin type 3 domain-containing protein
LAIEVRHIHRNRTLVVTGGALILATLVVVVSAVIDQPTSHSVALTWSAPAPVDGVTIAGYNIYRSTTAGGPYIPIAFHVSETAYKDTLVSSPRTYYYVVTSVDTVGRESAYSEEIKTVIP